MVNLNTQENAMAEENEISLINKEITSFFSGCPENYQREPWFSPEEKFLLPEELKDLFYSLRKFFKTKNWYNGGPIPDELIYTRRNFRLLQNVSLFEAVGLAYESIAKSPKSNNKNYDLITTIKVLRNCEKKKIKQEYIGGLLLLYLELCEKVVLL